ncbi:non-ribosomal peptide synthetase, partial [Westiellopsis prolifica IICB1]
FQVMFALQNAPTETLELTGLSVNLLPIESATAKFDITLSMQNTTDGLLGMWEYNTDLFDASTIERMIGHYVTLLEAIVNNPSEHIGQLPLLRESEKQQLLVEWNNTQADYRIDKCIHELFEDQVGRTPDALALVYDNQQLTYHQLNSRANQLAHFLQSLGVGADVLVGICVERSLEMVVAILGILKAGGAYVPLDPEYPADRLTFMLEDASVKVLLTQQRLLANLPTHQAQVVCLDTDIQLISKFCQDNAIATVQATNLAYVIYTSGSTGQPKGVMLSHRSLCNHMFWMQATFPLTEKDKVLQKTPFSFDASVWEFYAPLLVGGQLVLAQPGGHADPAYLLKVIAQQQVTTVQFVPSLLQILVEQRGIETCYSLKQIFCGGEALPITLQEKLFSNLNVNLHNIYGPTEACIDATFWTCNQGTERQFVPIGRPITNAQIYILDEYLQPVPVGVPGELHIGGAGLARGYLNRPELTQEKFIPNPFSKETESRLYKTGDLARYLEDGNIEYLGRIDNQVKIRGFRIELGEIEAVLSQYPHVQANCVIARSDTATDQRLIAYIVAQAEQTPTTRELRQFLKSKLPDYMVPSAFVILESLPLTPSGKIDRRALPIPSQRTPLDTFVSPRNQLELQLVQIWSKILKLDNVGVKDNFFDLGGHSLLAPYLIAQIKQHFGKDIPLATIFQHPTIEELAIIVQKDTDGSDGSALVAIQTNGSNPPLFCLPGAGGFPFYLYNLGRCLGTDQPFYTFQAQHRNGELAPIRKVEEIAAHYIQAIQTVQPTGPYFLAGHSFGGKLVYEMAQQLLRQGQTVALVAILDTTAPLPQVKQEEWDDTRWLIEFANVLKIVFARDLDIDAAPIALLAPSEQFKYVLEYLKMIDILPPDADTIYLNHLLQAYKADVNAEYVPQQIHPLPITLFRASESSLQEQTVIESKLLQDSAWGWSAFSSKAVDIQFVPGNHITMMTVPHVQVLAERLKACIQQAHNSTADDAIT